MKITGYTGLDPQFPSTASAREERATFRLPERDDRADGTIREAVRNVKAQLSDMSAQDAVHLHSVARQIRTNSYNIDGDIIAERMLRSVEVDSATRAYMHGANLEE